MKELEVLKEMKRHQYQKPAVKKLFHGTSRTDP